MNKTILAQQPNAPSRNKFRLKPGETITITAVDKEIKIITKEVK